MARVAIAIALLLALASTANCRPLLRGLLSYAGLDGDKPGMGPRTGTPFDPPAGSATKNIQGATVASTVTNGPMICAKYCGTDGVTGSGKNPTYYNYCNLAAGCGGFPIGTCDCKDVSGDPQYYADSTGTPGDGWVSGPVAAGGAAGNAVAFTDPAPKNLQGRTLDSFDFGAVGTVADCKGKCAANSECKGFNFCPQQAGCRSAFVGHCDIKTWDSGAATFYGDSTGVAGDGWLSSYRTNLSS
eukprot:jgi/Botrbrau1/19744/Bobra.0423s0003.1